MVEGSVHGGADGGGGFYGRSWDEALQRLEEFVERYPMDRALPNLGTILERAKVPWDFIREDDRAHKVLREAMGARPLSHGEEIAQLKTEVELLTLEVQVILDRLGSDVSREEERRAAERLHAVRERLGEIRKQI